MDGILWLHPLSSLPSQSCHTRMYEKNMIFIYMILHIRQHKIGYQANLKQWIEISVKMVCFFRKWSRSKRMRLYWNTLTIWLDQFSYIRLVEVMPGNLDHPRPWLRNNFDIFTTEFLELEFLELEFLELEFLKLEFLKLG
jgi:hypothetical protein